MTEGKGVGGAVEEKSDSVGGNGGKEVQNKVVGRIQMKFGNYFKTTRKVLTKTTGKNKSSETI